MRDMAMDAYAHMTSLLLQEIPYHDEQEPIFEAKRFLKLLNLVERPLYEGCEISLLNVVA